MTQATRRRGAQEARTLKAYKIMQQVYNHGKAEGKTAAQIHQAIRDAYPWGERRAWPYKAWLQAKANSTRSTGFPWPLAGQSQSPSRRAARERLGSEIFFTR